ASAPDFIGSRPFLVSVSVLASQLCQQCFFSRLRQVNWSQPCFRGPCGEPPSNIKSRARLDPSRSRYHVLVPAAVVFTSMFRNRVCCIASSSTVTRIVTLLRSLVHPAFPMFP